jgi:glycosyltransferase involved in cell wall biosynthesis
MLYTEPKYDNPYKPITVQKLDIAVYYHPKKVGLSFSSIAEHHLKHLQGLAVEADLDQLIRGVTEPSKVAIIHPIFYPIYSNPMLTNILRRDHDTIIGVDVADSDAISPKAVEAANKLDLIIVPSECSKQAYRKSGVKTQIEVIPHGLSEAFYQPPRVKREPSILFFNLHSDYRKGGDIIRYVAKKLLEERPHVKIKARAIDANYPPNVTVIREWISEQQLIDLYDSCSILLAPSRGGGFEANILEALARGLVVITSDWAAIQEYAAPYALTAKTKTPTKPLPNNPIHIGYGANPDPEEVYNLTIYALDHLDELLAKAKKAAKQIKAKYPWSKTLKRFREILEEKLDGCNRE